MTARRKTKSDVPEPSGADTPPAAEAAPPPEPVNRAIKSTDKKAGLIKVRANRPIGEFNEKGEMVRYAKGDEFYIDAARARALGPQVTETSG